MQRYERAGRVLRGMFVAVAAVLLMGMWATEAHAQHQFGDIVVSSQSPPHANTTFGYVEYRFNIANRSMTRDHRVTIQLPASSYDSGEHIRAMQRTVDLPAGTQTQVSMYQPALSMHGTSARLIVGGESFTVGVNTTNHGNQRDYWYYSSGTAPIVLLASPALSGQQTQKLGELLRQGAGLGGSHRGPTESTHVTANLPSAQWSSNWLAYSAYSGVVLGGQELSAMPPAVRDALWAYVVAGGNLLVIGEGQVPEQWARFGTQRVGNLTVHQVGFGTCLFVSAADYAGLEPARIGVELGKIWQRPGEAMGRPRSVEEANRAFPVIEAIRVPVRGLLGLMVVFAVVIGPLNLVVMSKLNRRMWSLWTIPLISLLFSGAVFGYATFAEGWTGHGRVTGITLLDQQSNRATTLGYAGFYSPLTPGDGLRYSDTTEVTPQVGIDSYYSRHRGSARMIDWTHEQHLAAGWVTARVPAHFALRSSEVRRERVTVQRNDRGELEIVNGLGAAIEHLHLMDDQRNTYYASGIAPGGRATLNRLGERLHRQPEALSNTFVRNWSAVHTMRPGDSARPASHGAATLLYPNTYVAVVTGAPFVEPGLTSAQQREEASIVLGILEEAVHAD